MVWFRVGCCERCGGVGSRGERGRESGTEAHTVLDSIPSNASIIPKMRMMRGSGGTIPLGGGTWPRDWYIYASFFESGHGFNTCLICDSRETASHLHNIQHPEHPIDLL